MPVKYVFVTGGVVSGLGKGITAASLGRLLKARGYKVKICLSSIVCYKHLSVLNRVHGTRININVWIELLHCHHRKGILVSITERTSW